MNDITELQSPPPLFRERHSLAIRIWHWVLFLFMAASLILVLLASTAFTMKDNIPVVQQQVQRGGGSITKKQARGVAHAYSDKFWMLHKWMGYGLCLLLLVRMIIEGAFSREKRFTGKLWQAVRLPQTTLQCKHYLLVKWGYLVFYVAFLIMALTGLGLAYEDVPFLRSIREPVEEVHGAVQYVIYFYILAHIVGVVRADVTYNKGIVSGMINGEASPM